MSSQILNKTHLEEILKLPIRTFSSREGSKSGDNMAGNLMAIKVETEAGQELNLVHKSLPPDVPTSEFILDFGLFPNENAFYSSFAPTLEKWIESRTNSRFGHGCESLLSLPKYYSGSANCDQSDYICLEDLRPSGYAMANKFVGLNLEETSLVMKRIAEFHAFAFGFFQVEGELDEFEIFKVKISKNGMNKNDMLAGLMIGCYAMIIDFYKDKNPELSERMQVKTPKTNDECLKTILATDAKYFATIIHGDFWMNNILFKYDEEGRPENVKFIDFQVTKRGNIFEDLQYFFFTSTTPEFRKMHLTTVLNIYYDSFVSALDQLKCQMPTNFSRDLFFNSFVGCYFPAFLHMCFAIPLQLGNLEGLATTGISEEANENGNEKLATIPQSNPETELAVNPLDAFIVGVRMCFETSQQAQERFEAVANELIEMKLL